jgi:hypothetical protein
MLSDLPAEVRPAIVNVAPVAGTSGGGAYAVDGGLTASLL